MNIEIVSLSDVVKGRDYPAFKAPEDILVDFLAILLLLRQFTRTVFVQLFGVGIPENLFDFVAVQNALSVKFVQQLRAGTVSTGPLLQIG